MKFPIPKTSEYIQQDAKKAEIAKIRFCKKFCEQYKNDFETLKIDLNEKIEGIETIENYITLKARRLMALYHPNNQQVVNTNLPESQNKIAKANEARNRLVDALQDICKQPTIDFDYSRELDAKLPTEPTKKPIFQSYFIDPNANQSATSANPADTLYNMKMEIINFRKQINNYNELPYNIEKILLLNPYLLFLGERDTLIAWALSNGKINIANSLLAIFEKLPPDVQLKRAQDDLDCYPMVIGKGFEKANILPSLNRYIRLVPVKKQNLALRHMLTVTDNSDLIHFNERELANYFEVLLAVSRQIKANPIENEEPISQKGFSVLQHLLENLRIYNRCGVVSEEKRLEFFSNIIQFSPNDARHVHSFRKKIENAIETASKHKYTGRLFMLIQSAIITKPAPVFTTMPQSTFFGNTQQQQTPVFNSMPQPPSYTSIPQPVPVFGTAKVDLGGKRKMEGNEEPVTRSKRQTKKPTQKQKAEAVANHRKQSALFESDPDAAWGQWQNNVNQEWANSSHGFYGNANARTTSTTTTTSSADATQNTMKQENVRPQAPKASPFFSSSEGPSEMLWDDFIKSYNNLDSDPSFNFNPKS